MRKSERESVCVKSREGARVGECGFVVVFVCLFVCGRGVGGEGFRVSINTLKHT